MTSSDASTSTSYTSPINDGGCSFVVPARNEANHLAACLDSLRGQFIDPEKPFEIQLIVVDNQSTDGTVEIATQHGAMVVSVQPGNAGRARNTGAQHANHQYLAFIDADCVLPKQWLVNTQRTLQEPHIVAVGCPQARAPQDAAWVERVWINTITHKEAKDTKRVSWLPSFNLLVRRADFLSIGGFDESLETCEDSDFSYRLGKTGDLVCNPKTPVRHLGESRTLTEFFQREMWRSRGNLASARKRGTLRKEFLSIFAPLLFTSLATSLLLAVVCSIVTPTLDAKLTFTAFIFIACLPAALSLKKGGVEACLQRLVLITLYLFARGIGMLLPVNRVERRDG